MSPAPWGLRYSFRAQLPKIYTTPIPRYVAKVESLKRTTRRSDRYVVFSYLHSEEINANIAVGVTQMRDYWGELTSTKLREKKFGNHIHTTSQANATA